MSLSKLIDNIALVKMIKERNSISAHTWKGNCLPLVPDTNKAWPRVRKKISVIPLLRRQGDLN